MAEIDQVGLAVLDAGLAPTDESRASIRAALEKEPVVPRRKPAATRRQRGWLVPVGVGLAAATLIAVAIIAVSDEPNRRLTPADTTVPTTSVAVAPTPSPAGADVSIEDMRGHRWVLSELEGVHLPPMISLPYIEFLAGDGSIPSLPVAASQTFLAGWDGCNLFAHSLAASHLEDNTMHLDSALSTAMSCPPGTESIRPVDGETLSLDEARSRLTVSTNGAPRLGFIRLDALPIPTAAQVTTGWSLAGAGYAPLTFAADGTATFGGCQLTWTVDAKLTVSGWPTSGYCANDSENRLATLGAVLSKPVDARLASDTDMYLSSDSTVIRLTRGPGAVPTSVQPATTVTAAPGGVSPGSTDVPRGLDGWPLPRSQPAELALVPRLLPTRAIPGAVAAYRRTSTAELEGPAPEIQVWFDIVRNARLTITTSLGPPNIQTNDLTPLDTSSWPTPVAWCVHPSPHRAWLFLGRAPQPCRLCRLGGDEPQARRIDRARPDDGSTARRPTGLGAPRVDSAANVRPGWWAMERT